MKYFEDIYKIADESATDAAFNIEQSEALYQLCMRLPDLSNIVEIGVEFGRSTSIIAEVKKQKELRHMNEWTFTAIDSYREDISEAAYKHVLNQIKKHEWKLRLVRADSVEWAKNYSLPIDLLHIDGDHSYEGCLADCKAWIPKVKSGGYICFDDYGEDSLPGVYAAVRDYSNEYENIVLKNRYGNKWGVFIKL